MKLLVQLVLPEDFVIALPPDHAALHIKNTSAAALHIENSSSYFLSETFSMLLIFSWLGRKVDPMFFFSGSKGNFKIDLKGEFNNISSLTNVSALLVSGENQGVGGESTDLVFFKNSSLKRIDTIDANSWIATRKPQWVPLPTLGND